MAPEEGLEPPTLRLTAARIYQLSYSGMKLIARCYSGKWSGDIDIVHTPLELFHIPRC
jgi:hypothetical protein